MRKHVIHRPGGYDRIKLEEHAPASCGDAEIRIAVTAAGVNYADCVIRMGLYKSAKELVGWPITPGFEVSGTVTETGKSVGDFQPGDEVMAVTLFGGYSDEVVVPANQVYCIPKGATVETAAGIPTVFLTAWFALCELAHPRPGAKVMIHSAAGGVGGAAIQLAKQRGCEVTAVIGSSHKADFCRAFGADHVIDKSTEDLWQRASDIAPAGHDVILDPNGVSTLADSYQHLAATGRLVIYGFHSMLPKLRGKPKLGKLVTDWLRTPRFSPLTMTTDNKSVLAFNLSFLGNRQDLLQIAMQEIIDGFASGALQPLPTETFPFAEAAAAQQRLETGQTTGKLLLVT